ncbi:MAG: zinc-binding dehydrogenase, partial [Anaerolineae bacterium]|nr:zinc-binding dehydrogenase [Anaerolineae bacterium]
TGSTGRRIPPMVMGHEFSGVISAVGPGVTGRKVGERVVVQPIITCGTCVNCLAGLPNICTNRRGLGMMHTNGSNAEYVAVPQQLLYELPAGVSWEQGALVEPLSVAMHAVNMSPIRLMDTVVILGAGTIGLLTLLACRLKGAGTVIVSDLSPHRLEMARRLGADAAVNPTQEDLPALVRRYAGEAGAPVVIEAVGITATARQSLELVRPGGHVTWIGNAAPTIEIGMQQIVTREITVRGVYAFNVEVGRAIEALATGRVDVSPIIEQIAPLEAGPQIFHDLARGTLDAIKVVLKP